MSASARPAWLPARASLTADVSVGLIVAVLTLTFMLSYAALVFGQTPASVQSAGLFTLLASTIVLALVGAFASTLPATFVALDGSMMAAIAAAAAAVTSDLGDGTPEVLRATLIVGIALTSLVTGAAMVAFGLTRVGGAVRFLPLQVVAGLFASTAWTLAVGGVTVALGHTLTLDSWSDPAALRPIGTAAAAAAVLIIGTNVSSRPAVIPLLIVTEIVVFHAVFAGLGLSVAEQQAAGWLLPEPSSLHPELPWSAAQLGLVDWSTLGAQWPTLAAMIAITGVGTLLSISGIELAIDHDLDLGRDLRAVGFAGIAAGLCGGMAGSIIVSRSIVLHKRGSRRRALTAASGVLAGLLPMAYPGLMGMMPRAVVSALLLFVAYVTFKIWLIDVRKRLATVEWLSILVVLGVTCQFGLTSGILTGLVLGCVTFALMYSRSSPIRSRHHGDVAHSHVDRAPAERAALNAQGEATLVLYLQGFLFFGTASRLLQEVKLEITRAQGRLRHLVLEGSNIDGLDGSARATFARLVQVANGHGISVSFAAFAPAASAQLAELAAGDGKSRIVRTLDEALERVEEALLGGQAPPPCPGLIELFASEVEDPIDVQALGQVLRMEDVEAGQDLMVQGEESRTLVFLERGSASVNISYGGAPPVRVRQFRAGTMLGEIGFLLGRPRTATVHADTACRIWVLTVEGFQHLSSEHPDIALALHRIVMHRLSLRLLDKDKLIDGLVRGTRAGVNV